jgi:hypothetical protein
MARKRRTESEFKIQEFRVDEAQREFNRRRSRGSKFDAVIQAVAELKEGNALIVEHVNVSEVTGIRQRITSIFGEGWKVESTKVNKEDNLYDLLIMRANK